MNIEKLTIKTQEALAEANRLALEYNHQQIESEHILRAMVSDPDNVVTATIKRFGVPADQLIGKLMFHGVCDDSRHQITCNTSN